MELPSPSLPLSDPSQRSDMSLRSQISQFLRFWQIKFWTFYLLNSKFLRLNFVDTGNFFIDGSFIERFC